MTGPGRTGGGVPDRAPGKTGGGTVEDGNRSRDGETAWPKEELERVLRCPVCGHQERRLLHAGLTDRVYACAPGRWDSHQCLDCGSAYLDPRPTPASIWRAYVRYCTHRPSSAPASLEVMDVLPRLRRALRNGYVNARHGTSLRPASPLGRVIVPLLFAKRAEIDYGLRDLPIRSGGAPGSVLDIGCGDGSFLRVAMGLGWQATGIDPDPKAAARTSGLDIRPGGLPATGLPPARYDVVTLSHVIEHVHDPVASLREVHRLLRPGGQVWIATPNIRSAGHRRFGADWIGLHPPAHLVLFTHAALWHALRQAGFEPPRLCATPPQVGHDHLSWRLSRGELPFSEGATALPRWLRFRRALSDLASACLPSRREEILVTARRPLDAGPSGEAGPT